MRILVTGASGYLGQKLAARLIELGHSVHTFGRSQTLPESLSGLNIVHHTGDITDYLSILKATEGSEIVFHLAGLVSYKKKDRQKVYDVNVTGTKNVMAACLESNVRRVIHTSSIAAFGLPPAGTIGDENIKYNLGGFGLSYCDTKHLAEQEVLSRVPLGLPAIILAPGIVFGEGDTHAHHHAIFRSLSRGWLIVPPGGIPFSDINDIVDAHISCLEKGRIGDRYGLVSANLSFKEAARVFGSVYNTRNPLFEIPGGLLIALGVAAETILPLLGINPPITRQGAWLTQNKIFFSSAKAEKEIDFCPTSFEQTVRRTADYYRGWGNNVLQKLKS